MSEYRYGMATLSLELTRRCNLQCDFCARGRAQDMDMSRQVIDAVLDQMQDVYINDLRLNGGEPFLSPDAIAYLVDKIIQRKTHIGYCAVFTNGTVLNQTIANALCKLADYLSSAKWEVTCPGTSERVSPNYYEAKPGERVSIILSQNHHDNADRLPAAIKYYGSIHPKVGIGLQRDLFIRNPHEPVKDDDHDSVILEGLAAENIHILFDKSPDRKARKIINKYNFIVWDTNLKTDYTHRRITKSISVAANGSIFIGCLMPYERVDHEAIGNILSNDLFEQAESFCWKHLLTKQMNDVRELTAAHDLLKSAGIETPDYGGVDHAFNQIINIFEKYASELHMQMPNVAPHIVQLAAAIKLCHAMYLARGADSSAGIKAFVNLMRGEFPEMMCDQLLSDDGRHQLTEWIERLPLQTLIDSQRSKTYADIRSEVVSERERRKWYRIHDRWRKEGKLDAIEATRHMIE